VVAAQHFCTNQDCQLRQRFHFFLTGKPATSCVEQLSVDPSPSDLGMLKFTSCLASTMACCATRMQPACTGSCQQMDCGGEPRRMDLPMSMWSQCQSQMQQLTPQKEAQRQPSCMRVSQKNVTAVHANLSQTNIPKIFRHCNDINLTL